MRVLSAAILVLAGCPGEFDPDLVGFQPEQGIYSPCTDPSDCGGDPCVGAEMIDIPSDADEGGVCSRWAEGLDPTLECGPYPDGYATARLAFGRGDEGNPFCVLECAGGLKCPVGMLCVHVSSVPYESEICM